MLVVAIGWNSTRTVIVVKEKRQDFSQADHSILIFNASSRSRQIVPSLLPTARCRPSEENARARPSQLSGHSRIFSPLATFHSRTRLSCPELARTLPSGENASALTSGGNALPVCPDSERNFSTPSPPSFH